MSDRLAVSSRFAGPPRSANGGYLSGRLAAYVDGESPVTVTLRSPPPLEVALTLSETASAVALHADETLVAEAQRGSFMHDPVEPVDAATARAAQTSYAGLQRHPFPGCFVCGTERTASDGLQLQPGLLAPGRTACTWTPHASLAAVGDDRLASREFAWAALDCPGGWTSDLDARPLVLGRMTALCKEPPLIGQQHVVVGRLVSEAGRKTMTATTLYDNDGRVLGHAEQVWIAVDPAVFS